GLPADLAGRRSLPEAVDPLRRPRARGPAGEGVGVRPDAAAVAGRRWPRAGHRMYPPRRDAPDGRATERPRPALARSPPARGRSAARIDGGGTAMAVMTQYQNDPAERDALVLAHVDLVKAMASRLGRRLPSQVELSELVSVGVLGLIEAANRYQPSLGVPFDAFARRRINGAMLDALREVDWAPRSLRRLRRDVDAAIARLRHELAREPKEHEVASALHLSPAQYERALEDLRTLEVATIRQLETTNDDGETLLDVAIDPGEGAAVQPG